MSSPPADPAPAPAAERPARPSTALLLFNLACLAYILWTGIEYTSLGLEVRGARVVALLALPFWPFYLLATLAAAGLGVFVVAELVRRRSADSRSYRLLPIAGLLFFVVHILVLPPSLPPVPCDWIAAAQLRGLEESPLVTPDGLLPKDPTELSRLLSQLPPPYLRDGTRMETWPLVLQDGCSGPVTELPAGIEPGTLLACVAGDRRAAWLTVAGTGGAYTGQATLVRAGEEPFSVQVEVFDSANLPDMPLGMDAQFIEEDLEAFEPEEP